MKGVHEDQRISFDPLEWSKNKTIKILDSTLPENLKINSTNEELFEMISETKKGSSNSPFFTYKLSFHHF